MPKLITTRARFADLGKTRIIVSGGDLYEMHVINALRDSNSQLVVFEGAKADLNGIGN